MQTKPIPCSGEPLGVIGLGTYVGFDVNGRGAYAQLQQVLHNLLDPGGSVIDSSPMYGRAEGVTGELLAASATGKRTFLATKVWTRGEQAGIAQMNRSMELLRTDRLDLMQVHNLLDWRVHLKTMRRMKEAGRIRHIGVTHYTSSAYAELETVLRAEPLDFVQLNYSVMDRAAEQRLLPLALERRVAVLANLPLASGSALRAVVSRPLPDGGRRARMHELGAAAAQVRRQPPGGDLCDPRHFPARAHGGQCGGGDRPACGRRAARTHRTRLCGVMHLARSMRGGRA